MSSCIKNFKELEVVYLLNNNLQFILLNLKRTACGGIYKNSIQGEFASPNYPESSPLNTYCVWTILASAGNLLTLEIKDIDITTWVH